MRVGIIVFIARTEKRALINVVVMGNGANIMHQPTVMNVYQKKQMVPVTVIQTAPGTINIANRPMVVRQ